MAQQNEIIRKHLQPALMDQKVKIVEIQELVGFYCHVEFQLQRIFQITICQGIRC